MLETVIFSLHINTSHGGAWHAEILSIDKEFKSKSVSSCSSRDHKKKWWNELTNASLYPTTAASYDIPQQCQAHTCNSLKLYPKYQYKVYWTYRLTDLLFSTQACKFRKNISKERLRFDKIYSIDFVARILVHFVELLLFYYYFYKWLNKNIENMLPYLTWMRQPVMKTMLSDHHKLLLSSTLERSSRNKLNIK